MKASTFVLGFICVSAALVSMSDTALAGGDKGYTKDDSADLDELVALPGDWSSDDLQVYDTCDAATSLHENIWAEDYCIDLVEDSMDLKTVEEREEYVFEQIEGLLPSDMSFGECYSGLVERFWECVEEDTRFEQNVCVNRAIRVYNDCLLTIDEEVGK